MTSNSYTKIPYYFREEYHDKFRELTDEEIKLKAETDPVIFGHYFLGKKVRLHQAFLMAKFIELVKKGKVRLALCWARQLGKTIFACILLIWLCWYNKMPTTIAKMTIWYVISRDDETAVEFLEKIRFLLYEGDRHMSKFVKATNYFTGSLKEPNNTHQITFLNSSFIKSVPPTKKALGKSASGLWIDEAHRLNCTDIDSDTFFDYASAIVAETGGAIILSSSPEGIIGFFHKAIDPDKQNPENEYESIWFNHEIWDDGSIECQRYKEFVKSEKVRLGIAGRLNYWRQEYMADFTVTESSFFEHKDIDDAVKDTPQYYDWKESPCSIGYDYGMKTSRTVITVRTKTDGEIIQLFQYRCPADFDTNQLINPDWEHSIQRLKQRYNPFMIIVDDCPNGDVINRWFESNSGIEVKKYNFRSDQMSKNDDVNRNCAAYSYRIKLKKGVLKIPKWNTVQQFEMKILQETPQKVLISIKAPTGQLCDTFDSDMMACIPFLDMTENYAFEVDVLGSDGGEVDIDIEKELNKGLGYDDFHSPTDDECRRMIEEAKGDLEL